MDTWLENVRKSQICELQRMVRSIEKDKAAVLAGLTLPHSNGVVEGKVHKLKFPNVWGLAELDLPYSASECSMRSKADKTRKEGTQKFPFFSLHIHIKRCILSSMLDLSTGA